MTASNFVYHRPGLAKGYCDALQGLGLADKRSGLLLAAIRRIGKSTFLRQDLTPEALSRGWYVVMVDLWEDKSIPAADLLIYQIKLALQDTLSVVGKAAQRAGMTTFKIGTFQFDMSAAGLPEGVTIPHALKVLQKQAGKPVLLIIDEAQHALSSEEGLNAMFAVKAARDAMNRSDEKPKLMLVMTGSDRDKLAHLCTGHNMPFLGASVMSFPLLGRDFTDAYAAHVNAVLSEENRFNPDDVYEAFVLVNHRPELLRDLVYEVALEMHTAARLGECLVSNASDIRSRIWAEIESAYSSLSELQRAIIQVIAKTKPGSFAPYAESTRAAYGKPAEGLTTGAIMRALEVLREEGLIWKEARGAYELEDQRWRVWLTEKGLI